jgi:hypothetical protein
MPLNEIKLPAMNAKASTNMTVLNTKTPIVPNRSAAMTKRTE